MISHLRMEGKYEFHQADDEIAKHTHVMFTFTDGTQLRYLDVRKFGRMTLVPKNQGHQYKGILALGPRANTRRFPISYFSTRLEKAS